MKKGKILLRLLNWCLSRWETFCHSSSIHHVWDPRDVEATKKIFHSQFHSIWWPSKKKTIRNIFIDNILPQLGYYMLSLFFSILCNIILPKTLMQQMIMQKVREKSLLCTFVEKKERVMNHLESLYFEMIRITCIVIS